MQTHLASLRQTLRKTSASAGRRGSHLAPAPSPGASSEWRILHQGVRPFSASFRNDDSGAENGPFADPRHLLKTQKMAEPLQNGLASFVSAMQHSAGSASAVNTSGPSTDADKGSVLAAASGPVSSVSPPLQVAQAGLFGLHGLLGGPWWLTIVSGSLLLRTSLVPVTIWQMKTTRRMLGGPVAGHMQHLGKLFTKELQEPGANRVRLAQLYVQGVRAIFRKFNVKPIALFAVPLTQIATLLTFVYATRHLVMHGALDLSDQGALWFMDLSAKDTTMLLPLVAVSLSYTTLERSFGRTVQVPGQPVSVTAGDVVREVLQAMLVFGFPFIAQLPSGIFMYWIPSSAFGFCQNTLLKLPSVRAALGLTDPPRLNATPIVQQVPKSAVVSKHRPTSSASGASRSQDAGVSGQNESRSSSAASQTATSDADSAPPSSSSSSSSSSSPSSSSSSSSSSPL